MDKSEIKKSLEELKKASKKRKFKQRVELIINLKNLNLKKPDEQVDVFLQLHYPNGKPSKVAAFVGGELWDEAKEVMDTVVYVDDFEKYQGDKKKLKKLANSYEFFVAQANIMPQVAKVFGKVLGVRGKMPNPKAGCVVPPKASLKPLYERLQKTVRLKAKDQPVIKVPVGSEDQKDDELIDNILTTYSTVMHNLPNEHNNVKDVLVKFTMSQPVKIKHT